MLRAINISQRITFFVILMIAMTIAMAVLSFFMTSSVISEGTVVARNELLASQRARIKDVTHSSALGLAAMTKGLPQQEQLRVIADYVEKSRFEDDASGYFYVYEGTVCVAHPTQKQIIGKDLSGTADKQGVHYVTELSKASAKGGGFVDFVFPKPGAGDVFKLGYAENVQGTSYWIGTGVYIDNVDRDEIKLHNTMHVLLTETLTTYGGGFLAILLLLVIPLSYHLVTSITRPLGSITGQARAVAAGDLDVHIAPTGKDEVAVLEQALRDMVGNVGNDVHDLADGLGLVVELAHIFREAARNLVHLPYAVYGLLHNMRSGNGPFARVARRGGSLGSVAGHALHRGVHLVHGGGGIGQAVGCIQRALVGLLDLGRKLG